MPKYYTGAEPDKLDARDLQYAEIALGACPFDWDAGYDIEKELDITIPFKMQGHSQSCVGQAFSYYAAVLNAVEVGVYKDLSAKAIYSQIFLQNGGAYIRDAANLLVDYGALEEYIVPSYENGNPPSECFVRDTSWKTEELKKLASILASKEYRSIIANANMETFATAIRDNYGIVGGVYGDNDGTWSTNEPQPPKNLLWGHALYFGKAGKDSLGKVYSHTKFLGHQGNRFSPHRRWQKLRQNYFQNDFMFNPWTLVDKPNVENPNIINIINMNEKKIIIEGEAPGRKGIIINGKLREITKEREAAACLFALANNGLGTTVSKTDFDALTKDVNF